MNSLTCTLPRKLFHCDRLRADLSINRLKFLICSAVQINSLDVIHGVNPSLIALVYAYIMKELAQICYPAG